MQFMIDLSLGQKRLSVTGGTAGAKQNAQYAGAFPAHVVHQR